MHSRFLTDDPLVQAFFHAQQLFTLTFQHPTCRNTGPTLNHTGDLLGANGLGHHYFAFGTFGLGKFGFKLRDNAVRQLSGLGQIAFTFGDIQLGTRTVQLFFQITGTGKLVAFGLPLRRHFRRAILQVSQVFLKRFQTILGCGIIFNAQGLGLDLHLQDLTVQRIKLFGLAIDFHTQTARGLVHQINGFVRQEPIRNVAMRQRCRRNQSTVRNTHPVVEFVLFLDAAQNRHGVLNGRFLNDDRLETTGQGCVLFNVLPVLIQSGGTNTMQLTTGERRLNQVGGIHRTIGFASTDKGVHFVNE